MDPTFAKAHALQLANQAAKIAALEAQAADMAAIVITLILGSVTDGEAPQPILVPVADLERHRRHALAIQVTTAVPPKENETDADPAPVKVLSIAVVNPEAKPRLLRV